MVKITGVEKGSRADRAGVLAGDMLVSINDNEINDVLDYRFYLAERTVRLSLLREGEPISVKIKKGEYDDVGLMFETALMDKKRQGDTITLVVPKTIGNCILRKVPIEELESIIQGGLNHD